MGVLFVLGRFALANWRLIAGGLALLAVYLALAAMKHGYDQAQQERGRAEVRAAFSEETHKQCGDQVETPKGCFDAGVKSVEAEYTEKIGKANRTILDVSAALEAANRSIDNVRAESQRKAAAAAQALAALESRAKDAADKLAALQMAQPTGATPCESACMLLRSSSW